MAAGWARLVNDDSDGDNVINNASAWANHSNTPAAASTAAGWAGGNPLASTAKGWAALAQHNSDSDDDAELLVAPAVQMDTDIVTHELCSKTIEQINGKTTLVELRRTVSNIAALANKPTVSNIAALANKPIPHLILDPLRCCTTHCCKGSPTTARMNTGSTKRSITMHSTFSLQSSFNRLMIKKGRKLESKAAETSRLNTYDARTTMSRELMAISVWALQRSCANIFVEDLCDRVDKVGGAAILYLEKHRGDETPLARVNASDLHNVDPDNMLEGAPPQPLELAQSSDALVLPTQHAPTAETRLQAKSITTNLKVYQTDVEIGCLFLMDGQELLVTFKLVTSLSRLDRCTGVCYNWLHARQSHILPARSRFMRCQRLHTSDGDKAQDRAERILNHDRSTSGPKCKVPTLRSQCTVHRVYHVIVAGMALCNSFISSQVKLALSLRGPGHFTKFKETLWEWLLGHYRYMYEEIPQGAGPIADAHRERIWDIYFPTVRGKDQRQNRLKYWVLKRTSNRQHPKHIML